MWFGIPWWVFAVVVVIAYIWACRQVVKEMVMKKDNLLSSILQALCVGVFVGTIFFVGASLASDLGLKQTISAIIAGVITVSALIGLGRTKFGRWIFGL